jgi:hypothetical protein
VRESREYDSPEEESIAMNLLGGTASAIGYLGTSVFDAVLGRRVRAGISLLQGKKTPVSELFTVPVISDAIGWTDPHNTVTGKSLIGWDDDTRYMDDIAGIAVEMLTDPTTFMTGGVSGLFGTSTKAGKIIERAGLVDEMAKQVSQKLGRRVGRRELMSRSSLKGFTIPSSGAVVPFDTTSALTKRLDDASTHYGYKTFSEAQESAIGNQRLTAAYGFTKTPFKSTPDFVAGEGGRFADVQQSLDTFAAKAAENPLVRGWKKKFNKDVGEASTAAGQSRRVEGVEEARRRKYERTKGMGDMFFRFKAAGLNDPEIMDKIKSAVEKRYNEVPTANKSTLYDSRGFSEMDLNQVDRDVDEIVRAILPTTKPGTTFKRKGSTIVNPGDYAQQIINGAEVFTKPKKVQQITGSNIWFEGDARAHDYVPNQFVPMEADVVPNTDLFRKIGGIEKIPEARETLAALVKEIAKDNFDQLQRGRAAGIGSDALNSYSESYLTHFAREISDVSDRDLQYPKYVSSQMMKELQSPRIGMTQKQIKLAARKQIKKYGDVRGLWQKVKPYGDGAVDQIRRDRVKDEAAAPYAERMGTFISDIFETTSDAFKARKEIYKNVRGSMTHQGGVAAVNSLVMDASVSGPMAGMWAKSPKTGEWGWVKTGRDVRQNKIFTEYMGGDVDIVSDWAFRRDNNANLSVGSTYGRLGRVVGKKATDVIEDATDLRNLNEAMTVESQAYAKAGDIARVLEDADPFHVIEQRPLFADDALSGHLHGRNAVEDAIANANSAQRMYGDVATNTLTKAQGETVLNAMEKAGIGLGDTRKFRRHAYSKPAEALQNFLRINADEGKTSWKVFDEDMSTNDMVRYLGDNPHDRFIPKQANVGDSKNFITRSKKSRGNYEWFQFEKKRLKVLTTFGLEEAFKSTGKGEDAVNAALETLKKAELKRTKGEPLSNETLARLQQQAMRKSIKPQKKMTPYRGLVDSVHREFAARGMKPYMVPNAHVNDAHNAMSLSKTPAVLQDVLAVSDKVTDTIKSHFTYAWWPFLARNITTLAVMDLKTNAVNILDPREIMNMGRRFMNSYRLHSGGVISGASELPLFSDLDWGYVLNPKWKQGGPTSVPKRIPMPQKARDKIATNMIRSELMATGLVNPRGVGAVLEDRSGVVRDSAMALEELMPGVGKNVRGIEATMARLRGSFSKMKEEGIDFKHLLSAANPLNVRGGFFGSKHAKRSGYAPVAMMEDANDFSEAIGRTATWLGQLEKGVDPLEATIRSNAAHVDYTDLSNFERSVMKRIVPFYTYQRKMIPHLLRDMTKHPGGVMRNMVRAINVANGERRQTKFTPQQLAGQLALPLYDSEDGKVRAYIRPELPVSILNNMFTVGPDAYTTFQNTALGWLGQMHFIPKAIMETAYGKSTFQKGRNLEDMYSRIGIKDPITNQIVMASPLGRYASNFGPNGIMFDSRKSVGEKAFSFTTGVPISHIDVDKAEQEAIDIALNKALSLEDGVYRTDRYYMSDEDKVSDRAKSLMKLKTTRSTRRMEEGKRRKALENAGVIKPQTVR